MADPRNRAALHRLPGGVRAARYRAAHPVVARADWDRTAWLRLHLLALRGRNRRGAASLGSDLCRGQSDHAAAVGNDGRGNCIRGVGGSGKGEGGRVLPRLRGAVADAVRAERRGVRARRVRVPGSGLLDARSRGNAAAGGLPPARAGRRGSIVRRCAPGARAFRHRGAAGARGIDSRTVGGAAAPPHGRGRRCGARRPVSPPLRCRPRRRRHSGVAHPVGLGPEPVSLHPAARPHGRGRGGAGGHAAAPGRRAGAGSGGAGPVAVLPVSGIQESNTRCAAHHAANAPAMNPNSWPHTPSTCPASTPTTVPTTKLTSALRSFTRVPPPCLATWARHYTTLRSSCFSTQSASQATSGLQSTAPMGGNTRRIGSTSQSVSAYAGRIQREYRNAPNHDPTTRTSRAANSTL